MTENSNNRDSESLKNKSKFVDRNANFCLPENVDMSLAEIISEFEKIDLSYDSYFRGGIERGTIDPELKEIYVQFLKAVLAKKFTD